MRTMLSGALVLALAALPAVAQTTSKENQVRARSQAATQDEGQTVNRGRVAHQDSVPLKAPTLHGILVDAGCRDRSALNLRRPPEPLTPASKTENQQSGGVSAHGVTVDSKTTHAERSDVLEHQVPDEASRQPDPTCAITGGTRAFAVVLDGGRLVNLDEGGNTKAMEAVQSSSQGRAMLNGKGPAVKPKVTIKGRVRGDQVIVEKLTLG